jgi:uncharacterized protein YprB with RNaseH-like and TPR domain
MLERTFIHISGIGRKTEQRLWLAGIDDWRQGLEPPAAARLSSRLRALLHRHLPESQAALERGDFAYFQRLERFGETWRAYERFKNRCAFVDIETCGLQPGQDRLTVVGIYDGQRYRAYIQGRNLADVPDALDEYAMLVTFNGDCFDLPFLARSFRGWRRRALHVDLRWAARRIGWRGGLKTVERMAGFARPAELQGMDGFDAVRLWWAYENDGDRSALDTLLAYNRADVEALAPLMEACLDRLRDEILSAVPSSRAQAAVQTH